MRTIRKVRTHAPRAGASESPTPPLTSETSSPATLQPLSNPSPGSELRHETTPLTTRNSTRRLNLYVSSRTATRFLELQRGVTKRGLATSGPGRPAYGEATMEMLLDTYVERQEVRARLRARTQDPKKADGNARAGLAALVSRIPGGKAIRYPPVDTVLRGAFPHHRPGVRHVDAVRFCDEGLIEPFSLVGTELLPVRSPNPLFVPTYHYGRGTSL